MIYLYSEGYFNQDCNIADVFVCDIDRIPLDFYIEVTDKEQLEICKEKLNIVRKIQVFK